MAPGVLGLAVGAGVEAARVDGDDLHQRVAADLGQSERSPAQPLARGFLHAHQAHAVAYQIKAICLKNKNSSFDIISLYLHTPWNLHSTRHTSHEHHSNTVAYKIQIKAICLKKKNSSFDVIFL